MTNTIQRTCVLVLLALFATPIKAQQTQGPQQGALPGGASSLSETHEDWTVRCQMASQKDAAKPVCAVVQTQVTPQGQQVISVELRVSPQGLKGALIMPFGLAINRPVSLSIDEEGQPVPESFTTCIPAGCVVPIEIDRGMLSAMRGGAVMKVSAFTVDDQKLSLPVSLKGFSAAADRISELVR
ncbi:invasion associated locus B family protein [Pleomorphomonas oryzae]|uniref:invasion associated locus B family protein n=1 Tax=Pleomorphomonas oryzae TaxID=261934 RepID=UPI00040722F2|nr:invasion associated locus B family protein [Pleomorphomonas oryzae]